MSHEVVEAQSFWDCVLSMQRDDQYQAHLMRTMTELRQKPFQNPVPQTHDVGTARNGGKIYSADVGGRRSDRRVVWQPFNRTIVVLLYGSHAVQERAKRLLSLESSMAGPDFERAFNPAAYGHPDGEQAALDVIEAEPEPEVALAPEPTEADRELEQQLNDPESGAWFTRTEPEFLLEPRTSRWPVSS
jgi:hypothetical protein